MRTAGSSSPVAPEFAELVARRFAALSDPMRLRLVDALRTRGEASVQELADALGAGHANVSKHLGVLHAQRVVGRRKQGTHVIYRIVDPSVLELCDQVCGAIHEQLEELVALAAPPVKVAEPTGAHAVLSRPAHRSHEETP
jgi:DNA-binding transcriptional ArsR family regulator